jgi:hypothetical protein
MRTTFIALVSALLFIWAPQVTASYRDVARPRYGDPDEFQTATYRDRMGRGVAPCSVGKRRQAVKESSIQGRTQPEKRRYLSISFHGITFFLER